MALESQLAMYLAAILIGWMIPELCFLMGNGKVKTVPVPMNIMCIAALVSLTFAYLN